MAVEGPHCSNDENGKINSDHGIKYQLKDANGSCESGRLSGVENVLVFAASHSRRENSCKDAKSQYAATQDEIDDG